MRHGEYEDHPQIEKEALKQMIWRWKNGEYTVKMPKLRKNMSRISKKFKNNFQLGNKEKCDKF